MKLVKSFALIFLITVLVISFQNCTLKQNTGLLGSKSSGQSAADLIVEGAPFAYDVVVDTISYNSCVGENIKSTIPGFKIGVHEGFTDVNGTGATQGGAKLRTEFLTYVGANVSPSYPSTVITPAQIQHVLKNSSKNTDSYIQIAVRKKSDLSVLIDQIQPASNSVATQGRDGIILPHGLRDDDVLGRITKNIVFGTGGTILAEGQKVDNLGSKTSVEPIEANLGYNSAVDETFAATTGVNDGTGAGEQYADIVRQKFNTSTALDKVILAVTFGDISNVTTPDAGLNSPKRPDAKDKTQAYGRGYTLKFETHSARAGWRENKLTKVEEFSLNRKEPVEGTWSCSSYYIMRQSEWNNPKKDEAGCAPLSSTDSQEAAVNAKIKDLRRHYSEKEWSIGRYYGKNEPYTPVGRVLHTLCLVPKVTECYLPTKNISATNADVGVQYNPGEECYLSRHQLMGVTYTNSAVGDDARNLGRCPQFASICKREL